MLKGLIRAAATLLVIVAVYGLLGFFVFPPIALHLANQQLARHANVPATLQRVEFDPFHLKLVLHELRIGEPGDQQLGFERLQADLQLDSLWRGVLHLAAVELSRPRVEIAFAKDGTLNLTQLFRLPDDQDKPDEPARKPFPLRIDSLKLDEGYLRFRDLRPSEPIAFVYDSLNLELNRLSTLPDDHADMLLVAKGPDGGRLDWKGSLGLAPFTSQGTLQVTDARMKLWWPYVRDHVALALDDGLLSFSTHYRLSLAKHTELSLKQTALKVAPLSIKTVDGRQLGRLANLQISDASIDLARQRVTLGKVHGDGLEAWAALDDDGELDWLKVLPATPAPSSTQHAPAVTAKPPATAKASPGPGKPWQVLLKDVRLGNAFVHLADRRQPEPVTLDVGPLDLKLQGFDSLGRSPFSLSLDTGVGKQGRLQASGQVELAPMRARLKLGTRDIDLRMAQAYLSPYLRLELRSGMLTSDLDVDLQSVEPLHFQVAGKAQVDQLHTLDTLNNRDLLKWQRLDLEGLSYVHGDALSIERVSLLQPYARFMINEDRTTNFDDLVVKPDSRADEAPVRPAAHRARPALGVRVGQVRIQDGSANFADLTLTPFFATAAQALNGTIGTIDNRAAKPAQVDIQGKVDRYAPVVIHGALNPLDPMASLDIAASFRRVELTTLTPYSGKFAGYRIRKGRLDLDLHYLISQGQLKAENQVVIEQLQLGERVESPDAIDLPVRLAVALLKDSDGRIALSLPVAGDLNNPQFSVMPIVWQTLRNLLARAAQSPFRFIGGLVNGGGAQDLSTIAFAPGSSELSEASRAALDQLAKALAERPDLRLEIEGTSAAASDGPLIAQRRLEREYQAMWYKMLQRRGEKVPADASQLQVADEEKPAMLEAIYRTRLKRQPPKEWDQLERTVRTARLHAAVIDFWAANTTLLRLLGQDRASSIKDYLVDKGKLQDQRVYFLDTALGQAQADGRVVTPLHLDVE